MSRKRKHKNARMKKKGTLVLGGWGGRLFDHLGEMMDAWDDCDDDLPIKVSSQKSSKQTSKSTTKKEESVIPKFEVCPTKIFEGDFD